MVTVQTATYNDLPDQQNRLTVVVMSEFGRRLGIKALMLHFLRVMVRPMGEP